MGNLIQAYQEVAERLGITIQKNIRDLLFMSPYENKLI